MKSCKIASIEQMPTYTYLPTMRAHPPNNKKHLDHGTPLSGPKSCQNMMRTWAALAKPYCQTAGVSARLFNAAEAVKSASVCIQKSYLYAMCCTPACRININYIENLLVSRTKITSLRCRDHLSPCYVGQSHAPLKLEPLEVSNR